MEWFLYFMGSLWIVIGVLVVLYTRSSIEVVNGLMKDGVSRFMGLLPLILGALLIISAWWSEAFLGVLILGVIAFAKGIFILFASPNTRQKVYDYWRDNVGEKGYRLWGLIAVILGVFVFSAA